MLHVLKKRKTGPLQPSLEKRQLLLHQQQQQQQQQQQMEREAREIMRWKAMQHARELVLG